MYIQNHYKRFAYRTEREVLLGLPPFLYTAGEDLSHVSLKNRSTHINKPLSASNRQKETDEDTCLRY